MKTLLTLLVLVGILSGQTSTRRVSAYHAASASTSDSVTIQQPSSGARNVTFVSAWGYCSLACTCTIAVNGTAATTTALTPITGNLSAGSGLVTKAFSASNVGAGTTVITFDLAAGQDKAIDLTGFNMNRNGTTSTNLTLSTSGLSQNTRLLVVYEESLQ